MGDLYRCSACHKLTTLTLCPRCDAVAEPYAASAAATSTPPPAVMEARRRSLPPLTLEDIGVLAGARLNPHRGVAVAEDPEERAAHLSSENAALAEKLRLVRQQLLRSAMSIRDLHASSKLLHQHDQDVMQQLRSENAELRERLRRAEGGAAASPSPPAATVEEAPRSRSAATQQDGDAAVPMSSCTPPTAAQGAEKEPIDSLNSTAAAAAEVQPPPSTPSATTNTARDVPTLEREVRRLKTLVIRKTEQLDGLWERVDRAELFISDLLGQLGCAQDLAKEESQNTARLSQHLALIGEPPADIVGFMAIKEHSLTPRSSQLPTLPPLAINKVERRSFLSSPSTERSVQ